MPLLPWLDLLALCEKLLRFPKVKSLFIGLQASTKLLYQIRRNRGDKGYLLEYQGALIRTERMNLLVIIGIYWIFFLKYIKQK